ncbi:MAG: hypothetical protein LUG24_00695 [Clostridiales bacterium]|nr:hypothetical protein [Clostridiales bacterium]
MKKFFWNIFVKSGSIDAFLGFKECEAAAVRAEAAATGGGKEIGHEYGKNEGNSN